MLVEDESRIDALATIANSVVRVASAIEHRIHPTKQDVYELTIDGERILVIRTLDIKTGKIEVNVGEGKKSNYRQYDIYYRQDASGSPRAESITATTHIPGALYSSIDPNQAMELISRFTRPMEHSTPVLPGATQE